MNIFVFTAQTMFSFQEIGMGYYLVRVYESHCVSKGILKLLFGDLIYFFLISRIILIISLSLF